MAKIRYKLDNKGEEYSGLRKDLNLEKDVELLQKQKVAFMHIDTTDNHEELALFEIFCSMKLKTWLNPFETH